MKKIKIILLISSVILMASIRLCFVYGINETANKSEDSNIVNENETSNENNILEENNSSEENIVAEDTSNNPKNDITENIVNNTSNENNTEIKVETSIDLENSQEEAKKTSVAAEPKQASRTLENGVYTIYSALGSNMVLDIDGGSKNSCANLQLWTKSNVDQQKFKIEYLNNGYYKIISLKSNKALDVANGSSQNGANVWQYDDNGTKAQQWIIQDAGNGYYNIVSACGGLYLDVANGRKNCGTNIQIYQEDNTKKQKFKFSKIEELSGVQSIEDGIYMISSALDNSKVIDVSSASTEAGANIHLWTNVNQTQQKFIVTYIGNGYYTFENFKSEKVWDVAGGGSRSGTNVWQYHKNNTIAQKWVIKDCGDGYYNIISACGGMYIDVANGKARDGANIQVYEGNNTKAQKFKFNKSDVNSNKVIKSGTYIISSKLENNKVFDISNGDTYSGANLQLWDDAQVKQQRFEITYLGNCFYEIKCVKSGKALDVAGGGSSSGTNVWQYQANNSKAQQWIIKDAGDGYFYIISRCNELYIDVANGKANCGTNIQVYEGNYTPAQKFKFVNVECSGIDVSSFQGSINWRNVKNSGIEFAMVRIGIRGYETGKLVADTRMKENLKSAVENGIDCGGYFVTQARNYQEGVEEAEFALRQISGSNITRPIAIDVEWAGGSAGHNGRADNISVQDRTQAIKGFCETIKNAGYTPMIYANKEWLTNYIDMSQISSSNVWLAHYVKGAPSQKSNYNGQYSYWQYTSTGTCDGIGTYVDLNKCF